MTVQLAEVLKAADAPRPAPRVRRRHSTVVISGPDTILSGVDLMREIRTAMAVVPAARRLDKDEADALAQTVALTLLSGRDRLRGTPAQVLRWIDRCERFPTLARRAESGIPRGAIGRNLLAARVRSCMAQRADWQDTASRYRTRAQSQADTGPMIAPLDASDDHAGNLAATVATVCPDVTPADVPDLARIVAARLLDCPADSDGARFRRLTARLVQAMALAGRDDPAQALTDLAHATGRTLNATRIDASRGADVLAELEIAPDDLATIVRDAARESGLGRLPRGDRPDLDARQLAAGEAVAALARDGGAWDAGAIGTARSLPDWDDRTAPCDAAPFPGLARPDVQAPCTPIGRKPRPCGDATVVLRAPGYAPRPARPLDAEEIAAREARYGKTLDAIGRGPARSRKSKSKGTGAAIPAWLTVQGTPRKRTATATAPTVWAGSAVLGSGAPVWDTDARRWRPAQSAVVWDVQGRDWDPAA